MAREATSTSLPRGVLVNVFLFLDYNNLCECKSVNKEWLETAGEVEEIVYDVSSRNQHLEALERKMKNVR
jgi:hypothetical protein